MKQFILANTVVAKIPSAGKVTTDGQVVITNTTGSDFMQITVGHGDMVVPDTFLVYKKDLRWEKTSYAEGTTFVGTITCGFTSGKFNETHIVISKLGTVFNERNVWTASGQGDSASAVATKLAANINMATATHGLTATASGAVVTLKAAAGDFTDYKIVGKNTVIDLTTNQSTESDATVAVTTKGKPGVGDKTDILNRLHACIGDKGLGYTNVEAMLDTTNFYLPAVANDLKCNIYTLSFYNPRYDHRIDEALFQKIHIAIPTTASATVLETALADKDTANKQESSAGPSTEE